MFRFGEISYLLRPARSKPECFSVVSHMYSTYFALYNCDFRLKSKTIKHCFYCNVESPSSLNRRHFLKKMSAGGKERASCVLGLLPCLPAYSRWVSSDGVGQAAPPTPLWHTGHVHCITFAVKEGGVVGEGYLNW